MIRQGVAAVNTQVKEGIAIGGRWTQSSPIPDAESASSDRPLKVCPVRVDGVGMTRTLWAAFAGRLAVILVAAVLLGGLAVHAAATRPDPARPLAVKMACFDPATPELGWLVCSERG